MSKVKQNMKRRKHENQEEERNKKQKIERKQQILKLGKTGSKILIADVSNEGEGREGKEEKNNEVYNSRIFC